MRQPVRSASAKSAPVNAVIHEADLLPQGATPVLRGQLVRHEIDPVSNRVDGAFHIGWKELSIGSWIARLNPYEYTLRATGLGPHGLRRPISDQRLPARLSHPDVFWTAF